MKILPDTNVIIDCLGKRANFTGNSLRLFQTCENGFSEGFATAQSVADTIYIHRKDYPPPELIKMMYGFCSVLKVVGVSPSDVLHALSDTSFPDFEDCVISKCAEKVGCDFIITRDVGGFTSSKIPALTPQEFLGKTRV